MSKKNYFEGWYFKHQKDDIIICFIVGRCEDRAFIQVVSKGFSKVIYYDLNTYRLSKKHMQIRVGQSMFSLKGCILDIVSEDFVVRGRLNYTELTPIKGDVMGPFKMLPKMECRHSVLSLDHKLTGNLNINGVECDFSDGKGYIEGDRGTSFPRGYFWCQCNDFDTKTSLMIAVANIPYLGTSFSGTICCVYFHGKEYRIATYKGARIVELSRDCLVIKQGSLRLEAYFDIEDGQSLSAPVFGKMDRTIQEIVGASVHFKMFCKGVPLFNLKSNGCCLEYVSIDRITA